MPIHSRACTVTNSVQKMKRSGNTTNEDNLPPKRTKAIGRPLYIPLEYENAILYGAKKLIDAGFMVTRYEIRTMAYVYFEIYRKENPFEGTKTEAVGWLQRFLERHPELSINKGAVHIDMDDESGSDVPETLTGELIARVSWEKSNTKKEGSKPFWLVSHDLTIFVDKVSGDLFLDRREYFYNPLKNQIIHTDNNRDKRCQLAIRPFNKLIRDLPLEKRREVDNLSYALSQNSNSIRLNGEQMRYEPQYRLIEEQMAEFAEDVMKTKGDAKPVVEKPTRPGQPRRQPPRQPQEGVRKMPLRGSRATVATNVKTTKVKTTKVKGTNVEAANVVGVNQIVIFPKTTYLNLPLVSVFADDLRLPRIFDFLYFESGMYTYTAELFLNIFFLYKRGVFEDILPTDTRITHDDKFLREQYKLYKEETEEHIIVSPTFDFSWMKEGKQTFPDKKLRVKNMNTWFGPQGAKFLIPTTKSKIIVPISAYRHVYFMVLIMEKMECHVFDSAQAGRSVIDQEAPHIHEAIARYVIQHFVKRVNNNRLYAIHRHHSKWNIYMLNNIGRQGTFNDCVVYTLFVGTRILNGDGFKDAYLASWRQSDDPYFSERLRVMFTQILLATTKLGQKISPILDRVVCKEYGQPREDAITIFKENLKFFESGWKEDLNDEIAAKWERNHFDKIRGNNENTNDGVPILLNALIPQILPAKEPLPPVKPSQDIMPGMFDKDIATAIPKVNLTPNPLCTQKLLKSMHKKKKIVNRELKRLYKKVEKIKRRPKAEMPKAKKTPAAEEMKYSCGECSRKFPYPSDLDKHMIDKHSNIRFACDKCDKTFPQERNLKRHQLNIHT